MRQFMRWQFGMACLILAIGCTSNQDNRDVSQKDDPPVQNASIEPTGTVEADIDPSQGPFKVEFKTTKGDFVIQVEPAWAPRGAARFRALVEAGFYDGCRFFRVVPDFMVQWGINGDPETQKVWRDRNIRDDVRRVPNSKGRITFANSGPNSRSTQIFINYKDNAHLDGQGFAPFGEVIEGMAIVESINAEYREKPDQQLIQTQGNAYLDREFPNLDYIQSAKIIE
jgi:cyclophilin family peptidyl-prolyl cis-trans isomerase